MGFLRILMKSQLTTFVFMTPPRNASKYVKKGGVLLPSRWGCGGQEVPDGVSEGPKVV